MARGKLVYGNEVNQVLKQEADSDSVERVFRRARKGSKAADPTWAKVLEALTKLYPSQGRQSIDVTSDIDDSLLDDILAD